MTAPVGVVGGGRFGRALAAAVAAAGHSVRLWSRVEREVAGVFCTRSMEDLVPCELVYLCVPSPHVPEVVRRLARHLDGGHLVVHVSRGLHGDDLETVSQVLERGSAVRRTGALAGPLAAHALEAGVPAGAVVGTRFAEVAESVRGSLPRAQVRVYDTDDQRGVELSSALVGLLALCVGVGRGMELAPPVLALLATRGMLEAARFVRALGGRWATLQGLAGWGDLAAALMDEARPEVAYGEALARGTLSSDAASMDEVFIEGRDLCMRVSAHAARRGIDLPLLSALARVIAGELAPGAAMEALLARPARREHV